MIVSNRRPSLAWTVVFFTCTYLQAEPSIDGLVSELRQGHIAPIKAAIASGADANAGDRYGNTLLMHAAVYATPDLLTFLLEHGADVNAANPAGHTALMRAIPDLAKVKLLIEHGALVNAATVDGTTPLLLAARIKSAAPLVTYLVNNGADVRAADARGSDAVMLAAGAAASENLRILLAAGASGDSRRRVTGPLRQAAAIINKNIAERGRRAADGSTALMGATAADCEECVRLLLSHGADVTAKTASGLTALHGAAFEGNPPIVRMLIDAGAPVNDADERGFTPLMMAANSRTKSPAVVRMLLAHDADVHMKDSEGHTASDWAGIAAPRELAALLPASRSLPAVKPAAAQDDATPKDIRAAVEKSISLLGATAPAFFRQTGCISCHNVSIPMLALTEARRRGYRVDTASAEQMVKQTVAMLAPHRDNLLSAYASVPGFFTTATYALMSMHGEGYRADLLTDGIARSLLVEQQSDGQWKTGGARPPLNPDSSVPTTALAVRALTLYPVPALSGATRDSIARARTWLLSAKPQVGDDYSYRLLGLSWTSAAGTEVEIAASDLISRQRPDGGWSQTPNMPSDAYATGLALSALAIAQPASLHTSAYRRGVDYLLATQESGGSWHVRTRAFGFQPYFESGFPHGRDQWISMAATAWSSYALMAAPPRPQVTAAR